MTDSYRTSRSFARKTDDALVGFTEFVITQMTGNPAFPTPIIPLTELTGKLSDFRVAITSASTGDRVEIATRNALRAALITLLRQQSAYVESIANSDLSLLLSSGFEAQSNNRTQVPLPKPEVLSVENPGSTKLAMRLTALSAARAYEVRISYGTSGWQSAGVFTQARNIVLENLTPGTTYTLQARGIGGSTGSSDWSDPVSHMAL